MACNSSGGKGGKASAKSGGATATTFTPQQIQQRKNEITNYLESTPEAQWFDQIKFVYSAPETNQKELYDHMDAEMKRIRTAIYEKNTRTAKKVINSDLGQFLGKTMSRKG